MQSVTQVADRAHGQQNLYLWVLFPQCGEQLEPLVHHLFHRQPSASETTFGLLVAVPHNTTSLCVLVHPCCAPSGHQHIQFLQLCVQSLQSSVDALQSFRNAWSGEVTMVHRAVPQVSVCIQVFFCIQLPIHRFAQGGGDGHGVVEHSIRIDIAGKLGLHQPCADVGGKARTHQQQTVALRKPWQPLGHFNGSIELIHDTKIVSWPKSAK